MFFFSFFSSWTANKPCWYLWRSLLRWAFWKVLHTTPLILRTDEQKQERKSRLQSCCFLPAGSDFEKQGKPTVISCWAEDVNCIAVIKSEGGLLKLNQATAIKFAGCEQHLCDIKLTVNKQCSNWNFSLSQPRALGVITWSNTHDV